MSSRTYLAKPSQPSRQNIGRGRGVNRYNNQPNHNTVGRGRVQTIQGDSVARHPGTNPNQTLDGPPGDSQPAGAESRMERREAYTVIRPDEKKRTEISEKARQEEMRYKQYKEQKRISHVSYVGSVGGGQVSVMESRQNLQRRQNRTKLETWQKIREHKEAQKSLENAEIERKKLEAQRKAEQNQRAERERTARLQVDHRRANEEFLRRLEQNSKKPATAARSAERANSVSEYSSDGATEMTSDFATSLSTLINMYPSYQPEILCGFLDQCDGNLEEAIHLLSG